MLPHHALIDLARRSASESPQGAGRRLRGTSASRSCRTARAHGTGPGGAAAPVKAGPWRRSRPWRPPAWRGACGSRVRSCDDRLDLELEGLAEALEGLTILHVSDVHAGWGPGLTLLREAAGWGEELEPDIVVVSGDLVARTRALRRIRPRSRTAGRRGASRRVRGAGQPRRRRGSRSIRAARSPCPRCRGCACCRATSRELEARGERILLAGADPVRWARGGLAAAAPPPGEPGAGLRILICHTRTRSIRCARATTT